MLRAFRPQAQVSSITCPVQILYAGQDLLVPPALARPSFSEIPNLTEATIDHAGHSIVWDAPQEVADHLIGFLKGGDASGT